MLTKLRIRNFKRFDDVEIELGNPVLLAGPNNSGKTTALQALTLWEIGLRRWREKRSEGTPEKRPGVTINRKDLQSVPVPSANLLWRSLKTRNVQRSSGKPETQNVRIDIIVSGVDALGKQWQCGLEFDFANDESMYCRPVRVDGARSPRRMAVPEQAHAVRMAFLPPMSGLVASESRLNPGGITYRLGEGRTAEVLRNLCYQVHDNPAGWAKLKRWMQDLYHMDLQEPEYIAERDEIQMAYRDASGSVLDISCSGRGMQQTLLQLAYLEAHPRSVLLLDEPDSHLEILRQQELFRLLREAAVEQDSQLIVATHSEAILNEAARQPDCKIVAFLGKPHLLPRRRAARLRRALEEVRFDQYFLAEQKGWVLYSDSNFELDMLRVFAARLKHPAARALQRPFHVATSGDVDAACEHFAALQEAKPDLRGLLLTFHPGNGSESANWRAHHWERSHAEDYLNHPATLRAFAEHYGAGEASAGSLFADTGRQRAMEAMDAALDKGVDLAATLRSFFDALGAAPPTESDGLWRLADFVPEELLDEEIRVVLDAIDAVTR
ncbi:MAG: AAA family ATPase [Bryobacteraceae bacterium]